ncbi:histidine phosphatase family protein [Lysinibacillus sp. NPDC093712]|uniref:histidine phosphatase family protein n=1 Tax=Lysinibacillus sp. NPDC093712 TaxID=3390579 RepID=UPI003CFFABDC
MEQSILDLLRAGGFILYVRHGEAIVGEDQPYFNFQYCYTQRNLSDYGRREAVYYGQMLRYWQIPINSPIIASPLCRTIETAQLAFPTMYIQIDPFWFEINKLGGDISAREQQQILKNVQSQLEKTPPFGTNQVIIAHSFPNGIGLGKIPNMGTVIVKPKGEGNGYEIVKQLPLTDLATLGNSLYK